MIVEERSYIDFNGKERTETFYFNLTKAELTKLEISREGGLSVASKRIMQSENQQEIWEIFEEIVLTAYGEKSDDGRRFIKNDEVRNNFKETNAYSDFIMELATNADYASKFINKLIEDATKETKPSIPAPPISETK